MRAAFYTLGCKVNQYDTQTMMEKFSLAGYEIVPFEGLADIYLINTCTVTAVSDKKSRQMIARAHARNPDAIIIVAGCYAQRDAKAVLALPGVSIALGNEQRGEVVNYVNEILESKEILKSRGSLNAVVDIKRSREFEELSAHVEGRTRAYLKIQEGCDRYCSYCIIPYARGHSRSRSIESIKAEAARLADEGFCELVLTGISLSSYSADSGKGLIDAIKSVSGVPGVRRIRLGSLDPDALPNDFITEIARLSKVCRHFHISMQSGSAGVLQRMNRRYTPEQYAGRVDTLRQAMPGCAITTDIIAGFPGETDVEHLETLRFVEKMNFARAHVFPFSSRQGTVAASMDAQLSNNIKEARAKELAELVRRSEQAYIDELIGKTVEIIVEERDQFGRTVGYTGEYVRVAIKAELHAGTACTVELTGREGQTAIGRQI